MRAALTLVVSLCFFACNEEPSCEENETQFLLLGDEVRYATRVSLLIEQERVVGLRGQNDRGHSFALRAAGVDLSEAGTHDISQFPEGITYSECALGESAEQCVTTQKPRKLHIEAHGGTLQIESTKEAVRARFTLEQARKIEPAQGDIAGHGCYQAPKL